MNLSVAKATSTIPRRAWPIIIIFGALVLLTRIIPTSGNAQSPTMQAEPQSKSVRILENAIPKHLPLAIKIRKEKEESFKAVNNEKWLREFELEVTNTGDKPIYFLYLTLIPDVKTRSGYVEDFPLTFGRVELGDIRVLAGPDDVAIGPGQTQVFKIHPGQLRAREKLQAIEPRPLPTSVRVQIQLLSFGDGTGFFNGTAIPNRRNKSSSNCEGLPKGSGEQIRYSARLIVNDVTCRTQRA